MNHCIFIMAGGLGKRMKSDLPKVLHKIAEIPMLVRVIQESIKTNPYKIFVVVGKYKDVIEQTLLEYDILKNIEFIVQNPALGTGHTLMCAVDQLKLCHNKSLVVLSGDVPLIKSNFIEKIISSNESEVILVTKNSENPYGYGRIVSKDDTFIKIVEEKDSSEEEKKIKTVNCGIYCYPVKGILDNVMKLKNNNAQQEYYITDLVKILQDDKFNIKMYLVDKENEYQTEGVNDPIQLKKLEDKFYNLNK